MNKLDFSRIYNMMWLVNSRNKKIEDLEYYS